MFRSLFSALSVFGLLCLGACFWLTPQSRADRSSPQGTLKAGVSLNELKVPVGHKMLSFPVREGRTVLADRSNRGTHDRITVRCLVLSEREESVALVSMDVAMVSNSMVRRIQDSVASKVSTPSERILIGATHTHQGPLIERGWMSTASQEWVNYVIDTVARTIFEAHEKLEPAVLGFGHGHCDLNYNRLFIGEDGRARYTRRNLERRYCGPADKEVVVLRVDRHDGRPLAVLFNYALHGVVMHRENLLISAEFPGPACDAIEARLGRGVTAIYFNGAEGEMNPYQTESRDFKVVDEVGETLAAEVLRVHGTIETTGTPHLAVQSRQVEFLPRNVKEKKETVTLSAVFLKDGTLVTVPGEMFAQAALEFKRRSPFSNNVILGLTGGAVGYIPHKEAYQYGGYGADLMASETRKVKIKQVPMGFAEKVWETWLEMTYKRWHSLQPAGERSMNK